MELAAAEERHARFWQERLAALGERRSDGPHRVGLTSRFLAWIGHRLGFGVLVPLLEQIEAVERRRYRNEDVGGLLVEESLQGQLVAGLAPTWRARASGSLRAGVFGANDGLVSNLSLVMGMAGGNVDNDVVLLAGLAGLVAGAGSMAAGEYISVKSQRELFEGEPALSGEDLAAVTGGTGAELELLMRLHGVEGSEASALVAGGDPSLIAEAIAAPGPDITGLGSPLGAAASSFASFALGASVPVVPFLVTSGAAAPVAAAILAGTALFVVGALFSLLTHRPPFRSGIRQLALGSLTATGTYLVGAAVDALVS